MESWGRGRGHRRAGGGPEKGLRAEKREDRALRAKESWGVRVRRDSGSWQVPAEGQGPA